MARFSLDQSRILLTGASSGIGAAFARALAREGARLAIAARRAEALVELADEIERAGGIRPVVIPADLSKRGGAETLAARAVEALGGVDVLINNAGVGMGATQAAGADGDVARTLFETNYWSPLALVGALVPAMRERGRGAVVHVTSLAQVSPFALTGHYASSKAALGLSGEALFLELRNTGVHVLEIAPGPVDTAMLAEAGELDGVRALRKIMPTGNADELAKLMVRALERRRRTVVYPRTLVTSWWFPQLARRIAAWLQRGANTADERVVLGGSEGNVKEALARQAAAPASA